MALFFILGKYNFAKNFLEDTLTKFRKNGDTLYVVAQS